MKRFGIFQARISKKTGLYEPIGTHGDALENRCASHFCHQRLGPMKEAPQNEGAFLVSATPHIGKPQGVGYLEGKGMLTGPDGSASLERSGPSSGTQSLVWNCGL